MPLSLADMQGYSVGQFPQDSETTPGSIIAPSENGIMPQPMIPPAQSFQAAPQSIPPTQSIQPDHNSPGPESIPVFHAIDQGYADPKLTGPLEDVRRGVQLNDEEMIAKGADKIYKRIEGNRSWGERFGDAYFRNNEHTDRARKITSDLIMREMLRHSVKQDMAAGLLQPSELVPGEQTQPTYGHLIPAEPFAYGQDGMPISSVMDKTVPAQPGQQPNGMQLIPGALSNDPQEELVKARIASMTHQRLQQQEGLAQFNIHRQALVAAHMSTHNGQPPNDEQYASIIAQARGQFKPEPRPGSLTEDELKGNIGGTKASTMRTVEQTKTEQKMRHVTFQEAQARITSHLASANLAMANASDAVRKGQMAIATADLQRSRAELANIHSQITAVLVPFFEAGVTPESKIEIMNFILKLSGTGYELTPEQKSMVKALIPDFGKPDATLTKVQEPGHVPAVPPQFEAVPPSINPMDFAPTPPPMSPAKPPTIAVPDMSRPVQPLIPQPQVFNPRQQKIIKEYNRLRKQGLSVEDATIKANDSVGK